MRFVWIAFALTCVLLIVISLVSAILNGRKITVKDFFIMAATIVLCVIFSIAVVAGILFVICKCLPIIGITSIRGWTIRFSWPLVAVVWYSMILINAIKQGGKRR